MTAKDRLHLTGTGGSPLGHGTDLFRSVLAAFDRQAYPTPITIRLGPAQAETVDLGRFKLVVDIDDRTASNPLRWTHDYEPHVRRFVESVVRPGMTAVDIGANIGFTTMTLAALVGSGGKVFAFEPNSENCRLILLSAAANDFRHVTLFPMALDENDGTVFLSSAIGSNGSLMPAQIETLLHPNCVVVSAARLDRLVNERV
ncbi:MAG: FkbM family methyltransferase, partial [Stellaceae bacterium]